MNIQQIIENYDKKQFINKKLYKYSYKIFITNESNKIEFYKNDKLCASSEIYYIAKYNIKLKSFIWAWSDIYIDINSSNISRKILNYGLDLIVDKKINSKNNKNIDTLVKLFLINSNSHINYDVNIVIILSLLCYIINSSFIYTIKTIINNDNYIVYYSLNNLIYHK